MAGSPKYLAEYQVFSSEILENFGKDCYFCGSSENVFVFYMLTSKSHKKDRLFLHPDHAKMYYPTCQVCMQQYARNRDIFIKNLSKQGVPWTQSDEYLRSKIAEFLPLYTKGDVSAFKVWLQQLSRDEVSYIPNYDDDPIIQLLPSLSAQLTPAELQFAISRIKRFREEFLFNASSDYIILLSLVIQEVRLQRMMEKMINPKGKDGEFMQREYTDLMKEYRENLAALGVLRRERDKIGGTNIAEIADLIGDENQTKIEIENWDKELDAMMEQKKVRDDKLGYYD